MKKRLSIFLMFCLVLVMFAPMDVEATTARAAGVCGEFPMTVPVSYDVQKMNRWGERVIYLSRTSTTVTFTFESCQSSGGGGGYTPPYNPPRNPTYTMTFYLNGSYYTSITGEQGQYVNIPGNPCSSNQTFSGWDDGYGVISGRTRIQGYNETIRGTCTTPNYTVNLNPNGGSYSGSRTLTVRPGATATFSNPTRTGYTFKGWYNTTAASGGTRYYSGSTRINSSVYLYARWTANTYTVTFNSNGGTSVPNQTVSHGGSATRPTNPTRTGHTFKGWYTTETGSTAFGFSSITSNRTAYAQWTPVNYTVTFNTQGGSAVANQTVAYGGVATQPTAPTRTGYTFKGWYTTATGNTAYNFGTTVTGATTVYAQWTPINYTVTFNSNGGTSVANQTVQHGSKATQPANPTRTNYLFEGWTTTLNGTTPFNFDTAITSNQTAYAKWKLNAFKLTLPEGLKANVTDLNNIPYGTEVTITRDTTLPAEDIKSTTIGTTDITGQIRGSGYTFTMTKAETVSLTRFEYYKLTLSEGLKSNQANNLKIKEGTSVRVDLDKIELEQVDTFKVNGALNATYRDAIKNNGFITFTINGDTNLELGYIKYITIKYDKNLINVTPGAKALAGKGVTVKLENGVDPEDIKAVRIGLLGKVGDNNFPAVKTAAGYTYYPSQDAEIIVDKYNYYELTVNDPKLEISSGTQKAQNGDTINVRENQIVKVEDIVQNPREKVIQILIKEVNGTREERIDYNGGTAVFNPKYKSNISAVIENRFAFTITEGITIINQADVEQSKTNTNEYFIKENGEVNIKVPEGKFVVVDGKGIPKSEDNTYIIVIDKDNKKITLRDRDSSKDYNINLNLDSAKESRGGKGLFIVEADNSFYKSDNFLINSDLLSVYNRKALLDSDGKFYVTPKQKVGITLEGANGDFDFLVPATK